MGRMPRLVYFWPGLPQLWHSGLWSGLILAAGFAVLFDLLLLSSFVWVELLRPLDLRMGWMAAGALWGGSAILSISRQRRAAEANPTDRLYRTALTEYLQGSWFEAEATLGRLLRLAPRDVEGRLLLATLLGRAKRHGESLDQLDRLERLRDAARWTREIAQERQLVAERMAADETTKGVPVDQLADASPARQAA